MYEDVFPLPLVGVGVSTCSSLGLQHGRVSTEVSLSLSELAFFFFYFIEQSVLAVRSSAAAIICHSAYLPRLHRTCGAFPQLQYPVGNRLNQAGLVSVCSFKLIYCVYI